MTFEKSLSQISIWRKLKKSYGWWWRCRPKGCQKTKIIRAGTFFWKHDRTLAKFYEKNFIQGSNFFYRGSNFIPGSNFFYQGSNFFYRGSNFSRDRGLIFKIKNICIKILFYKIKLIFTSLQARGKKSGIFFSKFQQLFRFFFGKFLEISGNFQDFSGNFPKNSCRY